MAYVSQLGNEDLLSDYIFTSQRESHSLPDMGFLLTLNYYSGHHCTPTTHSAGGGGRGEVEPPTKFLKMGCLTGPQLLLLEGGCWERRGDFFRVGVAIFI